MGINEIQAKLCTLLEAAIKDADNQLGRTIMDPDRLRAATGAVRDLTQAICLLDDRVKRATEDRPYNE